MQVIKPVETCAECQRRFQELRIWYGMHQACPGDPGAIGLLTAAVEEYHKHHSIQHPIHPDQQVGQ